MEEADGDYGAAGGKGGQREVQLAKLRKDAATLSDARKDARLLVFIGGQAIGRKGAAGDKGTPMLER